MLDYLKREDCVELSNGSRFDVTLFILSKDKVYKDIEAEILPKIKDILRIKPSLRFAKKKKFSFKI